MQTTTTNQSWHMAQWGTWGWLETIAKCVALIAGFIAYFNTIPGASFMLGGNPHLAAFIVLAVLTLASIAQVAIRFGQRDTISMGFAVLNLLEHLALLLSLEQVSHQRLTDVVF